MRLLAAVAITALLAVPAVAQQHKNMPGMDMHETKTGGAYRPGLGDLMTALVQPHHIKLALAGIAGNWPLAGYELDELRESFETVSKLIVKHGDLDIAPAVDSTVKSPMDALAAAIKAKDAAAFTKSYADLTDACNACHKSAGHAMIVIEVPDAPSAAFPDQNFAPAR